MPSIILKGTLSFWKDTDQFHLAAADVLIGFLFEICSVIFQFRCPIQQILIFLIMTCFVDSVMPRLENSHYFFTFQFSSVLPNFLGQFQS